MTSLLDYYQEHQFNPVPIDLNNSRDWESHVAKRRNLYQNHLGLPLHFLHGRSVLEFGSNSGENVLVLAAFGARLTLVEPNEQVWPRLQALFARFQLGGQIESLTASQIEHFEAERTFDLVVAEGFLCSLPNPDAAMRKLGQLISPSGLGVISWNDQHGMFLEMTRRMLLRRACQLAHVTNVHNEDSLALAKHLFEENYSKASVSRPFHAWWKDVLVNPFMALPHLWSFRDVVTLVEHAACEIYATSPKWMSVDHYSWYKNILPPLVRHQRMLSEWPAQFAYFITGCQPQGVSVEAPRREELDAVTDAVRELSQFSNSAGDGIDVPRFPRPLGDYLVRLGDPDLAQFSDEMKRIYDAARSDRLGRLVDTYHESTRVQNLWGTPYHYVSFTKVP